ncbi:molybdopterin synthase catalytic subunit [Jannaschia pagri]|uniref:Molybdopterin synthase catalytic subunit n=1 Tax=Jannaschia pagri TaxID=2829797 RepID=A0ABQ4NIK4_9RHOB|nr:MULTISPECIES: molybdopterin synthase catalytic subunit MoaE [unclassified Jannaschia]GIT89651.1 molybdopterin synthase catalytic subunit [Jannaschia sp. AI_61]GIT94241.1 molybdopterin synthase catalytic subunit [Jannaschia sp. AI_62]
MTDFAPRIVVTQDDFDLGAEAEALEAGPDTGAVVTFTGRVRNVADGLHHMEIEHYPGMTERALTEIAEQAAARWPLSGITVIHRYGALRPGARIMMVATASRHRDAAFEAASFLMDYLKSRAPFWKKEVTGAGADWVDAKDSDEDALARWSDTGT